MKRALKFHKRMESMESQIYHLQDLLCDSKRLASGEYKKSEIREEIESLREEIRILKTQHRNKNQKSWKK